ncbi:hypothetical protein [Streptomyces hokutonensis]|uniref:hypothetical protein n=1 Tax=Streptomyces hokutonensis TaxID=1306990 RepID=UPI00037AEBE6|nr:hypothetical protein [Streptomyces hokutonensis]
MRTNHVPAVDATATGHLPYAVQTASHPADTTTGAREHTEHSDEHTRYAAAGLYVATCAYNEAITKPNPSATLDDMADSVAEIMPAVAKVVGADKAGLEFAETLRASIADRLWAFTAIEFARTECGDGYGYVFDFLADSVRNGGDPHIARQTALDLPKRIRETAEAAR